MRILLLENDKNMTRILTEMLVWMGHEVQILESIDTLSGDAYKSSISPGMLLVHLHPGLCDAEDIVRTAHAGCRDLPVVVISERSDKPGSLAECPPGVSGMVFPPITVGMMQGVVRRILEDAGGIGAPCQATDPQAPDGLPSI